MFYEVLDDKNFRSYMIEKMMKRSVRSYRMNFEPARFLYKLIDTIKQYRF